MILLTQIFELVLMAGKKELNSGAVNGVKRNGSSLAGHFVKLSDREKELTLLAAAGLTSNQIALKMHISHATVQKHRNNILCKLNATNMVEVVAMALRKGWIE